MQISTEVFSDVDLFTQLGECDFIIYYNEQQSCQCHYNIIAAASITIRSLFKNGQHPPQIVLHSPKELHYFEDVIHFFYGSKLSINFDNVTELVQIGYILKSQTLLSEVIPFYIFYQRKENIKKEFLNTQNINKIKSSSIQFLAQFFQWLVSDVAFISQIHESILCQIISHPQFRIESEDFLIKKLIELRVPFSVFQHVRYEFVTPKGYKTLFDFFKPMNEKIYDILKQQFSYTTKCDPSNNPRFLSLNSLKNLISEYISSEIPNSIPDPS